MVMFEKKTHIEQFDFCVRCMSPKPMVFPNRNPGLMVAIATRIHQKQNVQLCVSVSIKSM